MPNIDFLLKLATRSFLLSFLALSLCPGTSLLLPVHASPLPAFPDAPGTIANFLASPDRPGLPPRQKHTDRTRKSAIQAIHTALAQVADGGAYRWRHRTTGLRGEIRPTTTYRNAAGRLCRHILYTLSDGPFRKNSEALACRADRGNWVLRG